MKRFTQMSRAFIMTSAMALALLLPTTTNAQTRIDDFFSSSNTEDYMSRSGFGGDFENQTFGENFGFAMSGTMATQTASPVGSGLLILTIAGTGYVLLKKKED